MPEVCPVLRSRLDCRPHLPQMPVGVSEMTETKLQISQYCDLVLTEYGGSLSPDMSLEYIEHSTDHWHSDETTSADIDKAKAVEIIEFLRGAFGV